MIFCWELTYRRFDFQQRNHVLWIKVHLHQNSQFESIRHEIETIKYILISQFGLFKKALARGPCELIIPVYEHMYLSDDAALQVSLFLHEVFVLKNVMISGCFVVNHNTERSFSLEG